MIDQDLKSKIATRASSLGMLKKLRETGFQWDNPFAPPRGELPEEFWTDDDAALRWFRGLPKRKRKARRD